MGEQTVSSMLPMTARNTDDEYDAWLDELDEVLELDGEEFDRRMQDLMARNPNKPERLPEDLSELFGLIMRAATLHKIWSPDIPFHVFEGFETYRCLVSNMAVIVEARDLELNRKVKLKFWKKSTSDGQAALLSEAQTLTKLIHPNIVTLHEARRWGQRVFHVTEWIDGIDGNTWMSRLHSWRAVRAVFVELARGLAAAHDRGIQHRDFKPDNMLIGDDGRVAVTDFGVAESLGWIDGDVQWGTQPGTPTYMAPERLRGEPGDARSDQFSFCVAMWRALYGFRPYAGRDAKHLLESIELGEMQVLDDVEVPPWVSMVMLRGLAPDPDERFPSMHEIIDMLLFEPPPGGPFADEDPDDDAPSFYGRGFLHKPHAHAPARLRASCGSSAVRRPSAAR